MAPLTQTNSKINTFKRSWEDAVDDPDADAYPWSPSPPKAKSEQEKPPSPPKMDGRARRRAAILKALASNSNAGSSNSNNNDRNLSSSYTNSRDEKQVKKIKPVEPKLVPVVKDHEDKDLKPITKPKPDVNHDLTKNELSKGPQIQRRLCLSSEQQKVLQLVADENKNVFFTGSAGTGKSVLLREIISALRAKWKRTPESVAVTASTGIAACNIGGTTLHSFTGCGLCAESVQALAQKVRRNAKALKRWTKVKVLIIDEISMVDGDLFDKLEQLARNIRKRTEPFGNIQIIVCGDFFQLPPVNKGSQPNFCFDAESWSRVIDHTINLRQVFRQRDETFVKMLNEMRFGQMSEDSIKRFKSLSRPLRFDDGIEPTELFPLRQQVDQSNDNRMQQLDGETKVFMALDSGDLPKDQRDKVLSNFMAPKVLHLKVNSQVMLIKNIDETLVNGSQGRVVAFVDVVSYTKGTSMHNDEDLRSLKRKGSSSVVDEFSISNRPTKRDSGIPYPLVQFLLPNGRLREILCVPDVWKTEGINGKIEAARNQVPLVLAWSMSIHKSQGQTLERVKVDLTKVFERGQSYVSLSRATTLDALQVIGFDPRKVTAHPRVIEWHKTLETV